jgi:hypothetical protein
MSPKPILCTKFEGGEFYPWPLPRQPSFLDHRVHSIFFDDGSILDSQCGHDRRPGDAEEYRRIAARLNAKYAGESQEG